ncbi:hypothetical protein M9H77_28004 [Catharanthus roseus]|uniref:Uncharacterized protein n=1 Tax=Catharanthus roseus TaxID=4058 RepID=A0ACC0AF52_CATRO|nr:hypothetical protein M9H77_28004 [Catharanthus roseus]
MSVPKIETDRFDGKYDFVMWRRKMKIVLVQNKIAPTICSPKEYPESWKGEILKEKLDDAHSCLTLHLTDNYGRDDLSLSDVKNALKSKDLDLQKENKSHGENFFVRGRMTGENLLVIQSKIFLLWERRAYEK